MDLKKILTEIKTQEQRGGKKLVRIAHTKNICSATSVRVAGITLSKI